MLDSESIQYSLLIVDKAMDDLGFCRVSTDVDGTEDKSFGGLWQTNYDTLWAYLAFLIVEARLNGENDKGRAFK